MSDDFKLCPFCGSSAEALELADVDCELQEGERAYKPVCRNMQCLMYNGTFNHYPSKDKAREAWNKRGEK